MFFHYYLTVTKEIQKLLILKAGTTSEILPRSRQSNIVPMRYVLENIEEREDLSRVENNSIVT